MSAWKESFYEVFIDFGSIRLKETVKAISKRHAYYKIKEGDAYNKIKKENVKIENLVITKIP